MEFPKRKSMRLKNYDYSQNGAYFVTICAQNRSCIFGEIVGDGILDIPIMNLSDKGIIVKNQMEEMAFIYTQLNIVKYIIMPNHIHFIILINENDGASRTPLPTNATVPQFVSTLKRFTNKKIGFSVWQRSYHDHIIRSEQEYMKIVQYIDTNPLQWEDDCCHTT